MKIKGSSVHIAGIRPETVLAMLVVNYLFQMYDEEMIITSVVDSQHSIKSLHYAGAAFDVRTSSFPEDLLHHVVKDVRSSLGFDFDVVLESDHMHIEFQPKYR